MRFPDENAAAIRAAASVLRDQFEVQETGNEDALAEVLCAKCGFVVVDVVLGDQVSTQLDVLANHMADCRQVTP